MSHRICKACGYAYENGDVVKAVIITRFVSLPSKVSFALEKPEDVEEIRHADCRNPKMESTGD